MKCRKTLCLVLVVALVASTFGLSANADFTDQDEIDNQEAAVVLEALGVIDGYEDGSYQPDTVLTREEAAAIIARMLLGGSADSLSASSAPFSDVSADRWSAGYIAYCAEEGIVDGFEDGTFRPTEELTCVQFAKMLLVALGYDAETEGLTGSTWSSNSSYYALSVGIFNDVSDYSGSADRDTVALMALNTLKADLVAYPGSIEITTGDSNVVISGSSAERIVNNGTTDGNIYGDNILQFAERYFTGLRLSTSTSGAYGRPSSIVWTLNGSTIYSGIDTDTLLGAYSDTVSKGTLYSLIGSSAYNSINNGSDSDGSLHVYVDGVQVSSPSVSDYFARNSSSAALNTGRGVQTEVYMTGGGDVYIVIINSCLAVAVSDYDAGSGTLDVTVYSPDGSTRLTLTDDVLNISGYYEGDWLLLTFDDGEAAGVSSAGITSGEITGYTEGESITVNGTRYYFAANMDTTAFPTRGFAVGSNISLILDGNGYVTGYSDASESGNYLYLLDTARTGVSGYEAAVLFPDGTYDEVSISSANYNSESGWYSYTVNSSGRYTLAGADNVLAPGSGTLAIRNGNARYLTIDGSAAAAYTATGSTVFIVYNTDKGCFNAYTGYDNVPDISGGGIEVYALTNSGGYSTAVVVLVSNDTVISGGSGAGGELMLVYDGGSVSYDSSGVYYTYRAFTDGSLQSVYSTVQLEPGRFYSNVSYDVNGRISSASVVEKANRLEADDYLVQYWAGQSGGAAITYSDDIISVGSLGVYELADNCSIYVIDASGYRSVSASGLAGSYSGRLDTAAVYSVLNSSGRVAAMYVVVDSYTS